MDPVSAQPTQTRPTVPPSSDRVPALTPRDPRSLAPGGPGEPPRPPRRTGGGGGGGGGNGGTDGPEGEGRPNRTGLYVLLGAGVVLVLVVLAMVLNGNEDDGRVAPANQQSTRFSTDTTPSTPTAKAKPSPTPAVAAAPDTTPAKVTDDSAKATNPQEETGGVAVGGAGQTGDAADSGDAEAEANAPLLQAGSVAKLTFKEGDTVRFRVTSPTAQEVHVHGFDKKYDIAAGETQTIAFPADLTGIFEVEFEDTATQIAELTIEP